MAKNKKTKLKLKWLITATVATAFVIIWLVSNWPVEGAPLGSGCFSNTSFFCSHLAYYHSTGNLSIEISQHTNHTFLNVKIAFIPKGTTYSSNVSEFPWNTPNVATLNQSASSGSTFNVTLPVSGPVPIGTYKRGTIWIRYIQHTNGTMQYIEVSNVTIEAT